MASRIVYALCLMGSPASGFGDKASDYPQTLCFLCVIYQAAIMSQRELRLLGDGWLRRKQPKRQERKSGRKPLNIFGRA
ncbi:MAG: hypothetical protein WBE46_03905, partial [Dehalococcoidia bacterium]